MKKKLERNSLWFYFGIFLLGVFQFFVVLDQYETIESQKVFWSLLMYAVPAIAIITVLFAKKITYHLFYSSKNVELNKVPRARRIKNSLASYVLIVLTFSFITYDTIIQTNDWFGQNKYQHIDTKVLHVELRNTKRVLSLGAGNKRWIITIEINGELVELTTQTRYQKGDMFIMTLNIGGAWGIIFAE